MMLIIQIAAGIILGVAILVYHEELFATFKKIGELLGLVCLIGTLIWAAVEAPDFLSAHSGEISEILQIIGSKIFHFIVFIFSFICWAAGAYGLSRLLNAISKFGSSKLTEESFVLMGLANMILVALVGWGLSTFTPFGSFADGVERWSREAGYKDFGSVMLFSLGLLWTYIPLSLVFLRFVLKQGKTPSEVQKH